MTVIIETSSVQEIEQLLVLLKSLDINKISISDKKHEQQPTITKGDKRLNPKELFGIWADKPRTLEQIRSTTWNRNWNI